MIRTGNECDLLEQKDWMEVCMSPREGEDQTPQGFSSQESEKGKEISIKTQQPPCTFLQLLGSVSLAVLPITFLSPKLHLLPLPKIPLSFHFTNMSLYYDEICPGSLSFPFWHSLPEKDQARSLFSYSHSETQPGNQTFNPSTTQRAVQISV